MTPLGIEIMIHYWVTFTPYDPARMDAPAVAEMHEALVDDGMLIWSATPNQYGSHYECNREAMKLYIDALCDVQLPRRVWVIPDAPSQ